MEDKSSAIREWNRKWEPTVPSGAENSKTPQYCSGRSETVRFKSKADPIYVEVIREASILHQSIEDAVEMVILDATPPEKLFREG